MSNTSDTNREKHELRRVQLPVVCRRLPAGHKGIARKCRAVTHSRRCAEKLEVAATMCVGIAAIEDATSHLSGIEASQ